MEDFFRLAVSTILLRPYVFAFLIAYLFLAYLFFGWRKVVVYTLLAWIIAFLSELSSIHNGFPYGLYKYTYLTQVIPGEVWQLGDKELYLFGVIPFIDSLSYTFLTFIGYALSVYINSPINKVKNRFYLANTHSINYSVKTAIIGAVFVTFMDIIIDPIATMGDRWFLGKIHYYVFPGDYFGVPISNFVGWFITSFSIIFIFQKVDSFLSKTNFYPHKRIQHSSLMIPFLIMLYIGVVAFNIVVTFSIGENHLGISSLLIEIPILLFFSLHLINKDHRATDIEVEAHLKDFQQ